MSQLKSTVRLALAIILCHSAGVIGSAFTVKAIPTWYAALEKPAFNPPNWVFAPVWLTIYTMMGVSLYLVLQSKNNPDGIRKALWIFGAQLLLNALWTPVFFGARLLLPAFGVIAVMWLAIIATIIEFWKHSRVAAALLVPYLLWVSFAALLNFSLWFLNR